MIKKEYDFVGNRKKWFTFSACLIVLGILLTIILGVTLDIQFTGGALIKYSYTGDIDKAAISQIIKDATGRDAKIELSTAASVIEGDEGKRFTVSFSAPGKKDKEIDETTTEAIIKALNEKYPDSNIERLTTNIVEPTMGHEFLVKCIVAVALAAFFMILYVAIRFRKIGGWSAGVMAVIAILHDLAIVFLVFVICRFRIDNNFVAVVLSIIGYSINSTIVVFDRIRENRKIMGPKATTAELVNRSINQTLGRTINSSLTTLIAVASIVVIAIIFDISSIITFAVPLMFGIISGAYSSAFISGPLWVAWKEYIAKKKA
ncbi:MAG: protein translocase subunit SecF [Clostridia bacterium]|nr:protein translocase subunit SecF [Clostridia bacterium]